MHDKNVGHKMNLEFLDKSSKMTPLLVKLYDSQKLHGLAKDNQPIAKAELTSAVAELFNMELSPREAELVADVLIELMRQAEKDLRQALAERLSIMENVPLRLVLQMANDEIDVAGCVLTKSKILSDLDLIYIIKAKGAEHWQSIAKRPVMSDQIINVLVDTQEEGTVETLLKNKKIKLTEHAIGVATEMACERDTLAKPLLQRDEATKEIAARLYHYVGEGIKAYIKENFEVDESVSEKIEEVIIELVDAADSSEDEFMPSEKLLADAERFKQKGLLTMQLMLGTLRRGQIKSFIAQFSKYASLDPDVIISILNQSSGQGLAVLCRAYEVSKADFISIFLLTSRLRQVEKTVNLKDMTKAIEYYSRIKTGMAKDILKNSMSDIATE